MNATFREPFFWRSRDFWLVTGLALLLRVLIVCWLNFAPIQWRPTMAIFAADALAYDQMAQNLLLGEGYHLDGDYREISSIPPLFSVWMAGLYSLFGQTHNVLVVGLGNAVWGALTAWLIYRIAYLCFAPSDDTPNPTQKAATARRIALVSGVIFAAYPLEIFNTPFVLKENFTIFLTAGFVLAWMHLLRAPTRRALVYCALWCGFLLGLSILSRLIHQGLAVVFLLSMLVFWRKTPTSSPVAIALRPRIVASTCVLLLVTLVTISPWLIRNYRVFGQVTMSPQGPSRYLFNSTSSLAQKESNGYYEGRGNLVRHNLAINEKTRDDPNGRERIFARLALRNFLENPGHIVHLTGGKLVSMWRPLWADSSRRSWLMLGIPYVAMMIFALPGLLLAPRRRVAQNAPPLPLQVLFIVTLFYVLGHALFYGMVRERQYVEPYLIIFAAVSVVALQQRWHAKRSGGA